MYKTENKKHSMFEGLFLRILLRQSDIEQISRNTYLERGRDMPVIGLGLGANCRGTTREREATLKNKRQTMRNILLFTLGLS